MDKWISRFRSAETVEGEEKVLIPGDPEREMEADRRVTGVPLLDPVVRDLSEIAIRFKIDF
jgi:L-2-hydroxycarboxylate dehydrogenase (NAD+)